MCCAENQIADLFRTTHKVKHNRSLKVGVRIVRLAAYLNPNPKIEETGKKNLKAEAMPFRRNISRHEGRNTSR
jgi:hypothetical protein